MADTSLATVETYDPETGEIAQLPDEISTRRSTFKLAQLGDSTQLKIWGMQTPRGTQRQLATLEGVVHGVEHGEPSQYDIQAGRLHSTILTGDFIIRTYETGEDTQGDEIAATAAYLPLHYMQHIEAVFNADPEVKRVGIDIVLGIESTGGKGFGYSWLVIEHDATGRHEQLRRKQRARREAYLRSQGKLTAPAPVKTISSSTAQKAVEELRAAQASWTTPAEDEPDGLAEILDPLDAKR